MLWYPPDVLSKSDVPWDPVKYCIEISHSLTNEVYDRLAKFDVEDLEFILKIDDLKIKNELEKRIFMKTQFQRSLCGPSLSPVHYYPLKVSQILASIFSFNYGLSLGKYIYAL